MPYLEYTTFETKEIICLKCGWKGLGKENFQLKSIQKNMG